MENGPGGAVDRRVQVGIGEDDVGTLATQLQLDTLEVALRGLDDAPAGDGGAGERNLAHLGMFGQTLASRMAVARHHVDHPGREADLVHQFGDAQGGQRGDLRRFDHHRVAGSQGRPHLPTGEHQREVPRHDLPDHTNRLALHVVEEAGFDRNHRSLDLVGNAAEVAEAGCRARYVEPARIANRMPRIAGFELGQLFGMLLDLVRQFQQQATALGGGQA